MSYFEERVIDVVSILINFNNIQSKKFGESQRTSTISKNGFVLKDLRTTEEV